MGDVEGGERRCRRRHRAARRNTIAAAFTAALVASLTMLSVGIAPSYGAKKISPPSIASTPVTPVTAVEPLPWSNAATGDGPLTTTLTRAGATVKGTKGRATSISLTGPRGLERPLIFSARALAAQFGNANTVIDQATLELVGVERAGRIIQISRYPFSFPVSTISLGPIAASALYGPTTAEAIRNNEAVLGKTSARLRHAEIGDELVIRHWDRPRALIRIRVGAIVSDEDAGSAEVVLSRNSAAAVGFSRPSRIVAWGNIAKVSTAWANIVPSSYLRRSATPPNTDSVLSQAELKVTFGEFTVRRDRGRIESDPGWKTRNVVAHNYPVIGRVACHKAMEAPLLRALTEIHQSGLSDLIDVADTKRGGGCYSAREIRTTNGTSGRNLSRHSWAAAIDLNPSTNSFGATPTMDPRIVYVFRRNGFAWGGTWSIPDGMHFELIGLPRIAGSPLPSSTTTTSTTTTSTTTTSTSTTTSTTTTPTATGSSTSTTTTSSTKPGRPTTTPPGPARSSSSVVSTTSIIAATQIPPALSTTTTTVAPTTTTPPLQEPSAGDAPA